MTGILLLVVLCVIALVVIVLNKKNESDPEAGKLQAQPKSDGIMIANEDGKVLFK